MPSRGGDNGNSSMREVAGERGKRLNEVQSLCKHVCKCKNDGC
jgi:hypothetical protein